MVSLLLPGVVFLLLLIIIIYMVIRYIYINKVGP